jgi:hypothetical protein
MSKVEVPAGTSHLKGTKISLVLLSAKFPWLSLFLKGE